MIFWTPLFLPEVRMSVLSCNDKKIPDNLVREVRHQLLLLPYYSVLDNPFYKVDGDKVTLLGQVVRPTLKPDAENAVKQIEGVSAVDNQIQVLPVSPMDDQLRDATSPEIGQVFSDSESATPSSVTLPLFTMM
jgi:hypothetical protein